jgi:hypothetical protein
MEELVIIYIHLNGQQIAEVFNLVNHGNREWSFICSPHIFETDGDYEIHPVGGRPMRIMISNIINQNSGCHIDAVEI